MKQRDDILRLLREYFKAPVQVFPATVTAVNTDELTCTVKPVEGPEIFDVRLKAGIDQVKDGLVEIPANNSSVLVGLIGNEMNTCFIMRCSQVQEVVMFGGTFGGLIKISELVSKLNNLENKVNTIISWGGSVSPPLVTTALVTTNRNELENTKVKH
jgi:hypothetical protein